MLFFIRRMHQLVKVEQQSSVEEVDKIPDDTLVYAIQGPFFVVMKKLKKIGYAMGERTSGISHV